MNVKLVSITSSLVGEKELSPENLIVYIARVSNPENQLNLDTSDKLLSYLIKHNHWSPFEMVDMTVEIKTSRAIAQQILRHRSFSFQEFSQRYSLATTLEDVTLRYKSDKNRQSSSNLLSSEDNQYFNQKIKDLFQASLDLYDEMISRDVAKECARFVLPLTTQTMMYMKGSIRSWIHYLKIRCDSNTQLEHVEIARVIQEIFKENFPNLSKSIGTN